MRYLPRFVRVASQKIRVRTVRGIMQIEDDEGHSHRLYGHYNENDQLIELDKHMGHERTREVLMHEAIHALFGAAQIDTQLDVQSKALDEWVVSALAPVMLAFIRDNPTVIEYLQEPLR